MEEQGKLIDDIECWDCRDSRQLNDAHERKVEADRDWWHDYTVEKNKRRGSDW